MQRVNLKIKVKHEQSPGMIVGVSPLWRNIPLGLKNIGQNVCFFNSVIQVLFCADSFREHIRLSNTYDPRY